MRLGVVLILEKERRNFAVEDMGAHEHDQDDDDDYVSGTARARRGRQQLGLLVGGLSEMEGGGRLLPSFSLSGKASDFFSLPSAQEDIKWQFELAPPRPPPTLIDSRARKGQTDIPEASSLYLGRRARISRPSSSNDRNEINVAG